ncbi:alpha/beta hydrolase [Spartinivicinus ruber]|uniref:alpha/beta hydrolase n=1 Tax=Spartinivicinus ruber TaxID=2683272 RepID=UPI0013D71D6F|nr:alpha/beta fold hydrolase [Spartinivicinus ruber]
MQHCILIPGMDGTGLIYDEFQQLLSDKNTHLTVLSYPTNQIFTQQELLNWLNIVLQKQDQPIWLIGESFGGNLAYQLASQNPNKIAGLILIASFLTPPSFLVKLTPTLFFQASWLLLQKVSFLRKLAMSVLLNKNCSNDTKTKLTDAIKLVEPKVIASRITQVKQLNIQPGLKQCHYLKPSHDRLVSGRVVHQLTQFFDETICHPIKGTHFLLQTNPKKCAEVVYKIIHEEYTS